MMWTIFLLILFVIGAGILSWMFWQKWTELRVLDVESIPESVSKKKKHELLRQRIERTGAQYAQKTQAHVLRPIGTWTQEAFRRFAGKLTAAERRYQQQKHKAAAQEGDLRVIDQLIDEAQRFMDEEVWDQAEKKLIQVIGIDPRHVGAYELLGRVYLAMKDFEVAKETFAFLHKLNPKDASVIASLGEVSEKLGDKEAAVGYFAKAVELSPKNPKYLDLWIESIIEIGDVHGAMTALDRLIEVNPENQKIPEFEKQIQEIRDRQKKK